MNNSRLTVQIQRAKAKKSHQAISISTQVPEMTTGGASDGCKPSFKLVQQRK